MRPGLRFRRVWSLAEASELGSTLAETIRSEFNAIFAAAAEPVLSAAQVEARKEDVVLAVTARQDAFVRAAIPEPVRHEVWRRDRGRCVDCGSRERLEFDHIIPISRGAQSRVDGGSAVRRGGIPAWRDGGLLPSCFGGRASNAWPPPDLWQRACLAGGTD